jgi:hypothetical protein
VRIKLGKTETVGEVVIADSGVVPPKVQLGVAILKPGASAAGAAGAGKTKPPKDNGAARKFDD